MQTLLSPDTPELRKARGAYFTPQDVTRFICAWAVRDPADAVLEPSAGDAAFLTAAVEQLRSLGARAPVVHGVELHADSANTARSRVRAAGGEPDISDGDFFLCDPDPRHDAVIGNPPYIRYQDFDGPARARSREAALRAGVALTALASSWAAFTVHAALFLKPGGRLALVLPAELLSVNYAAAVRRFLFERFSSVDLVMFEEQVFPDAEADVVLLLADGYGVGPSTHATIHHATNAAALNNLTTTKRFTPEDPADKWTPLLTDPTSANALKDSQASGSLVALEHWGDTTLGMVTGNNGYFTLSPQEARVNQLTRRDLTRISPPGSSHLRGLEVSDRNIAALGRAGKKTWLFSPGPRISKAAAAYIAQGESAGVHNAYKCRVRNPWFQVPLLTPGDLFLTCMNADTPRLTTNTANALHLNSVHAVYLRPQLRTLGRELLPLASLNSFTLLSAELVGRSYGGGILKLEPREADNWAVPSPDLVSARAHQLRAVRAQIDQALAAGDLHRAVETVDAILFDEEITSVRSAHNALRERRTTRGRRGN